MRKIEDFTVKGKRILLRLDLNVPLDKEGNILDDFRIKAAVPTIKYLREKGAKVIIISHLGRPEGERKEIYSLRNVAARLKKLVGERIVFLSDCIGKQVEEQVSKMDEKEIFLLENLRFYKGEKGNSLEFAERLARLGDIYVNDAFSVSHREHTSVTGLPKIMPRAAGLLLQKEIAALSSIRRESMKPLVVIMGGKKSAKLESLAKFLEIADFVLLNGYLAENVLTSKGLLVRESLLSEEMVKMFRNIDITDPKLHLPKDAVFSLRDDWTYKRIGGLGTVRKEEEIFDLGPETISLFSSIIQNAGSIVWAGPMGAFEAERFQKGTEKIGDKVTRNFKAFKVAGGGDTILALKKFGWLDKIDHVSTGGSAMLDFLCDEELIGVESLK